MRIVTLGHGTLAADQFTALVRGAGVAEIVDVRSFPGSRHNPQYGREEMAGWLPRAGLGYLWLRDLGGRRQPRADSPHTSLRHPAFRAYADHMETAEFVAGVDTLLGRGEGRTVMCSEALWWRCHRRLLADYLTLVAGVDVVHLLHDGRLTPHHPTDGVRLLGRGLRYDG